MKIDKGQKDGISLDGLSFIVMMNSPGAMIEGDIKVGLIIDEKADEAHTEAIAAIASGAAGEPMAGVEKRPISFSGGGVSYAVTAGDLLDQAVEGVPSMADDAVPLVIDNTAHPANSRLGLAMATRSMFNVFGIFWNDSTGARNGHFAPFSWAG